MEASAKSRLNVDESFFTIVRKIREREGMIGPEQSKKSTKPAMRCLLF
jgi:hypothetical protein